ncbi:MAG: hypothetical protein ACR2G0_06820 [Chthoniobacterales bacterium]
MARQTTSRPKARPAESDAIVVEIILIDQAPLRDRVEAECASAMLELEETRAKWRHFEHKDKPAFNRWRAREFGALLSQARDVETQIRYGQALVHEVEMEMRRLFQDPFTAYQRVMARRGQPAGEHNGTEPGRARPQGGARKLSEFEQEALFQEWVRKSLGTNPDKMDDEAYTTTFEAFKTHMFRAPIEEPRPEWTAGTRERPRPAPQAEQESAYTPNVETDARVKELYRRLVRRLHPDLRSDGNVAVSALWHEVQEAYAASDVARMEILLALSDIEAKRTADQSISQMRALRGELERALRALGKSLLEVEGEDAWDFARRGPDAQLKLQTERQLKSDLAGRMRHLEILNQTIAEWAEGRPRNRVAHIAR